MAIDKHTETLLTIPEAAKHCASKPARGTVWRWINCGVKGVRLEKVYEGGRVFTSVEALDRFHENIERVANGDAPASLSIAQQRAEVDRENKELEAQGVW